MADKLIDDGLFAHGKIFLIRTPVNANYGIPRLYGMVIGGMLGVPVDLTLNYEECYFVFTNKKQSMLMILHIDDIGITFSKRILHGRRFNVLVEQADSPVALSREQLRRLVLDGSYDGPWESRYLARQLDLGTSPSPQPQA